MNYPKRLEDLIQAFQNYPGVGRKTAERYALHTILRLDAPKVDSFAEALKEAKSGIFACSTCGHLTDVDPCQICADHRRDRSTILVLESAKDVFAMEKAGQFRGLYHVLNGVLSPLNGIGPDDLNIAGLIKRAADDTVKEVILATSATQEGEATAMYLRRILQAGALAVSRIAYGVPVGGNLEYADEFTLAKAIENRRTY